MTKELVESVRDAVALTALVAEAKDPGGTWAPVHTFARERLAEYEHPEYLATGTAHLLHQTLMTLADVLNGLPDDVNVEGIERPVTVPKLLAQLGADASRYEE